MKLHHPRLASCLVASLLLTGCGDNGETDAGTDTNRAGQSASTANGATASADLPADGPDAVVEAFKRLGQALASVKDEASARAAAERIDALAKALEPHRAVLQSPTPMMRGRLAASMDVLGNQMDRLEKQPELIAVVGPAVQRFMQAATSDESRQTALRIHSAAKLRIIGQGLLMYEQRNGSYPDTLQQLVEAELIAADALQSPMASAGGQGGEGDVAYIKPASRASVGPVLYDRAALKAGRGTNVAFVDGSVRWLDAEAFAALGLPAGE
ncbi:MAG: hypothetical protein ACFCVE_06225 [Phycisphaerae bacterium]